ncbi:YbaB/EbfC family nucleoid-associated protein [Saccharopolyspora erythraea]|nr:YbaB/EbfC family nucleoid-associated protein [Saccharopolyspora erythraea]
MMRRFEEQAAQVGQLREKMQEIRGQARSSDGAVLVTVAPSGAVMDLQLSPDAVRQSHTALQRSILGAIREATQDAAQQMDDTVQPVLGDRAEQFKNAFNAHSAGGVDPAGTGSNSEPARRPDDNGECEDDFSGDSFLR